MSEAYSDQIPLTCPVCGASTGSLKSYTIAYYVLFIFVYHQYQTVTYTACPRCMRTMIVRRTLITALPANIIWPAVIVGHAWFYFASFTHGHSKTVLKKLHAADASKNRP